MAKAKRKYPKQPKANASIDVWNRYKERIKEVDKANAQSDKDKLTKKRLIADVKKMKSKR
jgi:hypothetical protein